MRVRPTKCTLLYRKH